MEPAQTTETEASIFSIHSECIVLRPANVIPMAAVLGGVFALVLGIYPAISGEPRGMIDPELTLMGAVVMGLGILVLKKLRS